MKNTAIWEEYFLTNTLGAIPAANNTCLMGAGKICGNLDQGVVIPFDDCYGFINVNTIIERSTTAIYK